jgi:ParB/RepB/Spo0J family partition protein
MAKAVVEINENQIEIIPLSKVKADFKWNSRPEAETSISDVENEIEGTSFGQLMESIDAKGQREPVLVRPKGNAFELVYGFRRYAAIRELAKKNGVKDPTIRCVVQNLNDIEAREENMRENIARKQLTPSMVCKGLIELKNYYGDKMSVTALADRVGINRPYASMMINTIAAKLKPELLESWYGQNAEVGVNRVESVAKLPPEEQEKAWKEKVATGGRGNKAGAADWMEAAITKCESVGAFLGRLHALKLVNTDALDFRNIEHFKALGIKVKEDHTGEQMGDLVHSLTTAFNEAVELVRNPPAPAVKEEKPKKEKKAKAGAEAN